MRPKTVPAAEMLTLPRGKRDSLAIIADILQVALEGAGKTEIVYRANLNFSRADRYIRFLVTEGFLSASDAEGRRRKRIYRTTGRGRELLEDLRRLRRIMTIKGP